MPWEARAPQGCWSSDQRSPTSCPSTQSRQSSAEPTLSQPHYTLANSRLTWFSADEKLSVTGFVNNLTDRRYQVHGRPNGPQGQYVLTYGDPRTVAVSVTSRF